MKKNILPVLAFLLISAFARAQSGDKITLSLGLELGIPFNTSTYNYGDIRGYYKDGIGGSLRIELPVTKSLHFTASAGYISYPNVYYLALTATETAPAGYVYPSDQLISNTSYRFIPVKAGLQYYYSGYLYADAEAGAAIKSNSATKTSFIYSGGLGGVIPFNAVSGLDIGFRYERGYQVYVYPSPMSQFGIRLAYKHAL
ncbi:MAG: hypothetical protein JWQ66_435 [Mucilaginibacter sp.]|nr:hypothetical protein [Mucilaginibacter sp.]